MRSKVTLVLVFLNVALFFFIFKFERNWRVQDEQRETRRRVLGPEAADIRVLEVTSSAPAGSYRLVRRREAWFLTAPLDWPANPHAASAIATDLMLLEHETSFSVADLAKSKQSLADYGLDQPKITVAFASGDAAAEGGRPLTRLRIGDTSKDGRRLYVLSPDGQRVHIVDRSLLDRLSTPIEQLRTDTLLTVRVYEARSLAVQTTSTDPAAAGAKGAANLRVRILKESNGNRWNFAAPITARASRTAVELAINDLNALRVKSFPGSPPPTLPAAAPTLRVQLEGTNRAETLFIGEPVPAPAAGPARAVTGSTEYYGQLDGRNAVFTVVIPDKLMGTLRNAQEELREKRFLDFDPRAVSEIVLAAPVQPNIPPLTLQRIEPPAGEARDTASRWQIVRRGEGAQGPQTIPAEASVVQRLLERLSLLEARSFQSDAPTGADLEEWGFNRPVREVTLTLGTPAAQGTAALVLRIGTDAARRVTYARVGTPSDPGTAIYTIDGSIVDELKLTPAAWRNRTVLEPLPDSARLTALKLVDLNTKQPLFDVTFNAAGEPAAPADQIKAVQGVVAALRNLRAKEFLPGGFTDRVFAAGDERPWRFELQAAISLPGGVGVVQTSTLSLLLTERLGGGLQIAGSRELDAVFTLEQPFVDALWSLAYAKRDPGPPAAEKKS